MKNRPRLRSLAALGATLLAAAAPSAGAQIVQIRTLPVALGDQFAIHPSEREGLAGVSIALDDRLRDPFLNPALGALAGGSTLFSAPFYFSVAEEGGSGRTLPLGATLTRGAWFGSAMLALQELQHPPTYPQCCIFAAFDVAASSVVVPAVVESSTNFYGTGTIGRRFAGGRTAVGFGASYSHLDGVEGVGLLYPMEPEVRQDGSALDVRLGLTQALAGDRRLDLVLLRNRVDVTHEGHRVEAIWDERGIPAHVFRSWTRRDGTRTWGAQARFTAPLPEDGWRSGIVVTANHLRHPAATDPLTGRPWGGGESWAYNLGLGASREDGPVTFGMDVLYEPIWSSTRSATPHWGISAIEWPPVEPPVDRPVQNRFRFDNAHLRIGAGRAIGPLDLQLGTHLHSVRYTLREIEVATGQLRAIRESWMEWKPTWGFGARFPDVQVRYAGSYTSGVGRPFGGIHPAQLTGFVTNILVPPTWGYEMQDARVLSHRVSVSLPIELGRR